MTLSEITMSRCFSCTGSITTD